MTAGKTNAARILERMGVSFELRQYEVGGEHEGAREVANKVGLPPEQVFKTLVARGDKNGVLFAVIAADAELDLKALARLSSNRRVEMVPLKEVQPLTGYVRGGVTALGSKKSLPVYGDEMMMLCEQIAVSAGVRGMQIVLAPADYCRATGCRCGEITR